MVMAFLRILSTAQSKQEKWIFSLQALPVLVACRVQKKYSLRGGRVVSASASETSVSNSTPTSAIIYDAYTSIIKKKLKKKKC